MARERSAGWRTVGDAGPCAALDRGIHVRCRVPGPSTTPSASADVTVDLGAVGITPLGSRVTLHAFGPSDRSIEPPAGAAWFEGDVERCLRRPAPGT